MYVSWEPEAPPPTPTPSCVIGYDCPVQPGQCANGYSGNLIGHPCASGCAIGFGYEQQCQPSTCCEARSQYPPANGEHSEAGSGVWTSNALTVNGGMYVEVRCNAGYELTGRNLGFQLLGDWPDCSPQSGCIVSPNPGTCCYSFGANVNQRPWNWPTDASYEDCVNTVFTPSEICCESFTKDDSSGLTGDCGFNCDDEAVACERNSWCSWTNTHWYSGSAYKGVCSGGCSSSGGSNPECRFSQAIPADGSWRLEERTCVPISCGVYAAPAHGTVSPTSARAIGDTVTISCNAGYELTGDDRFSANPTCQANGQFTSGKLCTKRSCGPFPSIANGAVVPASGVVSGQSVVVFCNAGYQVTGDTSVVCDTGEYQIYSVSPSCGRISCGTLSIANGVVLTAGEMFLEDSTQVSCNAGFYLRLVRTLRSGRQSHAECTSLGEPNATPLVSFLQDHRP